ncbi:hypothetical protein [Cyclobacterium marinum]|uniref:hypothetical protein n=1 Tax=Cyclobacterium marinum TaxID=104 RepID=UPI0011ED32D2|nr:hypothetical protein [Cyclobacterium marinum]MBI0400595.1 hypothetical protein [Cyclobacterium marinum]
MDTSSNLFNKISSLFTSDASTNEKSIIEDFSEVKISFRQIVQQIPNAEGYNGVITEINNWDNIHISIKQDDEILANFANRNSEPIDVFVSEIDVELGSEIELIFTIEKNKENDVVSIYFLNHFIDYLESLSFNVFVGILEKQINKKRLVLYNPEFEESCFLTQSILLSNQVESTNKEAISHTLREERKKMAIALCHWEIEFNFLLPEDLYPIIEDNIEQKLIEIFKKVSLLYTSMFFFDYLNLKNDYLIYKLNGYRTFNEQINTSMINQIDISYSSNKLMYEIYQWAYKGGNTNDKVSIARNIISLNFNPKTLELAETVFNAIRSNYKIYERQNVKQYIEVRNKLSEILVDLQGKIDKIVSEFVNDYKKNIITLISFFISIIVIKVVSKGDFIGGFTNEILILSYSFLIISVGLLLYSRWEFDKRISMFNKHYNQLQNRYKDLLSEKELSKIFNECNPDDVNSKSFIEQQKRNYTILWIFSILVLAIALTIIWAINNIDIITGVKKILKILLHAI